MVSHHGSGESQSNSTSSFSDASILEPIRKGSLPVNVFWATAASTARMLVLPLNNVSPESSPTALQQHVSDCEPATFGRGQQDVFDVDYRRAGKMEPRTFATSFNLAGFGIVENIERILLPNVSTAMENSLGFRKLRVESYKLNVYSGPSGLFTPRSEDQIGSLVVCLPSKFAGGKFTVQHAGQSVEYDWSPLSDSTIKWAAFYRVIAPPNSIFQPKSLPLYNFLRSLICQSGFMGEGGTVGIYCSHAYPHSSEIARALLPRGLKGSDLVVYSVFKSLGIEVQVRPVLRESSDAYGATRVGESLWEYSITHSQVEDDNLSDMQQVIDEEFPSDYVEDFTWISSPGHEEMAFSYVASGNMASIDTFYSRAAILAVIPPFEERKGLPHSAEAQVIVEGRD
ncbi:uncharacterized protein BJX67DRAFT_376715 [Aspergillus lucknowensis]|uniref:Uncharacterized protein n=1 Tax=Aspergillus lucknowensis TaxID=176173 RepID=A0ABR4M5J2_9EURO